MDSLLEDFKSSRLARILDTLTRDAKIDRWEALAIYRCVQYSDQIADVSLGAMFRGDIENLLASN